MKNGNKIILSTLSMLSLAMISVCAVAAKEKINVAYGYSNVGVATYYSSLDINDTGDELLAKLQSLNSTKRQSLVGYGNMPSKFAQTDPGTSSGQVTSFYSGKSANYSGNMNREHVWPASRTVGGRSNDSLEDDIHMTRPTLKSENSARGNAFFAEGGKGGSDNAPWDPASFGNESYRGDSARIIFYCVVADSRLKIVEKDSDYTSEHSMGKLSDLVKWHLQYQPQEREKVRNDAAERLQGNRNPFIDHPEYVCRIWGRATKEIYTMCMTQDPYDVPDDPTPAEPTGGNNGCGGNIYTTSIVLSSLSILGAGLLLIRRFKKDS